MLILSRLIFAALVLTAVGQQLFLHVAASYNTLNFFSYFTNLSNLFAAAVLLVSAFSKPDRWRNIARYVSSDNMTVVGGYRAVAAYSLAIAAIFLLVSWALLLIGNRRAISGDLQ